MSHLSQLGLMALEAALVAVLVLLLFRLRSRLGLTPLYVCLGAFQFLQVVLALSVYVEIAPGLLVSPGAAVLFTATLFGVLLVYIREDADRVRSLLYGLVIASASLTLLSAMFGAQLSSAETQNLFALPRELFFPDLRLMLVRTAALIVDVVLVIVVYEAMSRVLPRSLFARIFTSMAAVLAVDSLIFVTGGFVERPDYPELLASNLVGKQLAAFFFSLVLAAYFRVFRGAELERQRADGAKRDVFQLLTYRQRYERALRELARDSLTGLFNRGFFDEILPLELARATRSGRPVSLVLIDIDHFKRINDEFGHLQGDKVLELLGEVIRGSLRRADVACRIGGEEFALVAPGADIAAAHGLAERIRALVAEGVEQMFPVTVRGRFTITAGVACFPEEATSLDDLFGLADRRLYIGKNGGRDQVVSTGGEDRQTQPIAVR